MCLLSVPALRCTHDRSAGPTSSGGARSRRQEARRGAWRALSKLSLNWRVSPWLGTVPLCPRSNTSATALAQSHRLLLLDGAVVHPADEDPDLEPGSPACGTRSPAEP